MKASQAAPSADACVFLWFSAEEGLILKYQYCFYGKFIAMYYTRQSTEREDYKALHSCGTEC